VPSAKRVVLDTAQSRLEEAIQAGKLRGAGCTARAAVESRTAGLPGNPFGTTRSLGFALGGPGTLRSHDCWLPSSTA
jgi:hypothetical protein